MNQSQSETAVETQLPNFLGIGSQRCGTSWTFKVLNAHPDIRMSVPKETNQFSRGGRSLAGYLACYEEKPGQPPARFRGELSPQYCRLSQPVVDAIARFLPHARIFLTIREPISRAWSGYQYEWGRFPRMSLRTLPAGLRPLLHCETPRSANYTDYQRTLTIWNKAFGREAVHVELFERIKEDPEGYYGDIIRHIGADPSHGLSESLAGKKANSTRDRVGFDEEIPEVFAWFVAVQQLDAVKRLDDQLEGRVGHWVRLLEETARQSTPGRRSLREFVRNALAAPERLAYSAYRANLDRRVVKQIDGFRAELQPR